MNDGISTDALIKRLRRLAGWLEQKAKQEHLTVQGRSQLLARANVCRLSAFRLDECETDRLRLLAREPF